jgi:NAD(P)H-dependent FMN reductase
MAAPKILAFAGSARTASINKKLAQAACRAASAAGAEAKFLDLADYPMPLYNQDLEDASGLPEAAIAFKEQLKQHQGFIIACPEYNGSITPLLKNAIDWATRPASPDEPGLVCFKGKTAALLATSPGGLGGLRGLVHVRAILSGIGTLVIPAQQAVPHGFQAFNDEGRLQPPDQVAAVKGVVQKLVEITAQLNA